MTMKTATAPRRKPVTRIKCQDDIKWTVPKHERAVIEVIVSRFVRAAGGLGNLTTQDVEMYLIACHNHAVRLDLKKLAGADDFNLLHDVWGICNHLDQDTCTLRNFFLPRCCQR